MLYFVTIRKGMITFPGTSVKSLQEEIAQKHGMQFAENSISHYDLWGLVCFSFLQWLLQ